MLSRFFGKQTNQSKQNWVSSKLVNAINTDDINTLNIYLSANKHDTAALNASNFHGQTILMLAIYSKNIRLTIKILAQPLVDVNAVTKTGECPLTIAMTLNDSVTMQYLLDRKDLNLHQHGESLFIWAIENGFESIIARLAKHEWFLALRERNPKFTNQLLEIVITKKRMNTLIQLINLEIIDVNSVMSALNKHINDATLRETLDNHQGLLKQVLCHAKTDFKWQDLFAHNTEAYLLLAKLGPAEIRFLVNHENIRIIHTMFTVVNPEGFQAKSVYLDKICPAFANPDNRVCNLDDLLKVLLQCPTFNRDMIVIENKTTNDLLRESILQEPPPPVPPARDEATDNDDSTEDSGDVFACRLT